MHGTRHGWSESHPPDLAADRGGGAAQYPPHPDPAQQHLPASGDVPYGRRSPGHLLTIAECCPGTLTNNGGSGGGVSAVRKNRAGTTDHGRNMDGGTLITTPNRKIDPSRTTHAISGLAVPVLNIHSFRPSGTDSARLEIEQGKIIRTFGAPGGRIIRRKSPKSA